MAPARDSHPEAKDSHPESKNSHPEPVEGLRCTEAGQGEPVLLLDWTPWESSVLLDGLAEDHRVISVDPPDGPAALASPREAAVAVAAIAKRLGLTSYAVVGASLGADAAFQLALQNPGSVAALLLVSPTVAGSAGNHQWGTPESATRMMLAHPEADDLEAPGPERTAALASMAREWAATETESANPHPGISCATLMVYGQEDRLVLRTAGHAWKEKIPNCSVSYVYDAGHAIALDRPNALLNVVLDFITRRETFIVESRSRLINP